MSSTTVPQLTLSDFTISLSEYPQLVFEETLRLVGVDGEVKDEVTVAVEDSGELFTVYQYGDNEDRMLRIQSSVFCSLRTQSEVRQIRWPPDRATLMRITGFETSYRIFTLCQDANDSWRDKMEIKSSPSDPILLEGANVLLLRKFAISDLYGQLKVRTINHDREVCDCVYDVEPRSDDEEVIVRRTLKNSQGTEVITIVLSQEGRILSQRWSCSEWCLEASTGSVKPERIIQEEQQEENVGTEEPLKADQTAYFQRKEEVSQKLRQYLLDHTDIQDLIADFLKNVLFEQPEDVVDFADNFFSEFLGIERQREDEERFEDENYYQEDL